MTCWLRVLGLSVSCSDGSASRGSTVSTDKHFETLDLGEGRSLPFAYHLPQHLDPEQDYRVLIGPGDGTPGTDDSFYWNKGDPSEHGWIIVESMAFLEREPVETTQKLLDHLSEQFKVEGASFTWWATAPTAAAVSAWPWRCRSVSTASPVCRNIRGVRIWKN